MFGDYWQSAERAREVHSHLQKLAEQIEQKRIRKESATALATNPTAAAAASGAGGDAASGTAAPTPARNPKWSTGALGSEAVNASISTSTSDMQSRSLSLSSSSSSSLNLSAVELSLPSLTSELTEALDSPPPAAENSSNLNNSNTNNNSNANISNSNSTDDQPDRSQRSSAERSSDGVDSPAPRTLPLPPATVKLPDASSNRFLAGLFGANLESKLNAAIKHYQKVRTVQVFC